MLHRYVILNKETRERLSVLDAPNVDRAIAVAELMFGVKVLAYEDK